MADFGRQEPARRQWNNQHLNRIRARDGTCADLPPLLPNLLPTTIPSDESRTVDRRNSLRDTKEERKRSAAGNDTGRAVTSPKIAKDVTNTGQVSTPARRSFCSRVFRLLMWLGLVWVLFALASNMYQSSDTRKKLSHGAQSTSQESERYLSTIPHPAVSATTCTTENATLKGTKAQPSPDTNSILAVEEKEVTEVSYKDTTPLVSLSLLSEKAQDYTFDLTLPKPDPGSISQTQGSPPPTTPVVHLSQLPQKAQSYIYDLTFPKLDPGSVSQIQERPPLTIQNTHTITVNVSQSPRSGQVTEHVQLYFLSQVSEFVKEQMPAGVPNPPFWTMDNRSLDELQQGVRDTVDQIPPVFSAFLIDLIQAWVPQLQSSQSNLTCKAIHNVLVMMGQRFLEVISLHDQAVDHIDRVVDSVKVAYAAFNTELKRHNQAWDNHVGPQTNYNSLEFQEAYDFRNREAPAVKAEFHKLRESIIPVKERFWERRDNFITLSGSLETTTRQVEKLCVSEPPSKNASNEQDPADILREVTTDFLVRDVKKLWTTPQHQALFEHLCQQQ